MEGLKKKYFIVHLDGTSISTDTEYFVLKLNKPKEGDSEEDIAHKNASRAAANLYAIMMRNINPQLSNDMIEEYNLPFKAYHEVGQLIYDRAVAMFKAYYDKVPTTVEFKDSAVIMRYNHSESGKRIHHLAIGIGALLETEIFEHNIQAILSRPDIKSILDNETKQK